MYLLNTVTFELEQRNPREKLVYAILSHTWDEEEVIHNDIQNLEHAKLKAGFAKIQGACEAAFSDNFGYIWIDTCCIDKSSSVELSEAINSMYKYYRDAEACYVYLSDVRSEDEPDPYNYLPVVLEADSDFTQCRWFTRGWTLQELLAPRSVIFYAHDWNEIGTKRSLHEVIARVTEIPSQVLLENGDDDPSIAQRMAWASTTNTTRLEDEAYCLMGLFGVNIPIIYGEGRRAFERLQLEILKQTDDQSIFAWHIDNEPARLLARGASSFCGCSSIVPRTGGIMTEHAMTNRGFKTQLPLLPLDYIDHFLVILNCGVADPDGAGYVQCSIVVKHLGGSLYERVDIKNMELEDRHLQYLSGDQKLPDAVEILFPLTPLVREEFFYQGDVAKIFCHRNQNPDITFVGLLGCDFSGCSYDYGQEKLTILLGGIINVPPQPLRFRHVSSENVFLVTLGWDDGVAWCDVIPPNQAQRESTLDIRRSYRQDGSRHHIRRMRQDRMARMFDQYRDITVSLRRTGCGPQLSRGQFQTQEFVMIINIQQISPKNNAESLSNAHVFVRPGPSGHAYQTIRRPRSR